MNLVSIPTTAAIEPAHLKKLEELKEEATKASSLIYQNFSNSFDHGKTEIDVFHNKSLGLFYGNATLTINGMWKYSDNCSDESEYKVFCGADGIYKCYRAYYFKENDLLDLIPEEERKLADVACLFRKFISELEEKS